MGYGLIQALDSALACDGVSCALCHQIQPKDLGKEASFSGHYVIEPKREIYGPYKGVFTMPMQHHLDLTPLSGEPLGQSSLCGSCHVLFTPIADASGEVHGGFPEQTTYLEWLNSRYAAGKSRRDCQDCHLRLIAGPVKITRRPPWFAVKREPFKQHTFNGGNRLVLGMLAGKARERESNALEAELGRAARRSESMLHNAASIEILEAEVDTTLNLKLAIENKTGHKLPTGYPSRRIWTRLGVIDSRGRSIFESGGYDEEGEIRGLDPSYEPHHELIEREDQVQVYHAVMGNRQEEVPHTLLTAATYLKDNRLPPAGFRSDGPWITHTGVAGSAANDGNFNRLGDMEGTGKDIIRYRIELRNTAYPLRVEAELLYQTVSGEFVRDLLRTEAPAAREFGSMYRIADQRPFRMAKASLQVTVP